MAQSEAAATQPAEPKTVLITGVSRGCGRAMAMELARRGHTIVGVARSEEKLASLREECPRPKGQRHVFTTLDVTSDAGVKELAQRVLKDGVVPDIVINNAGVETKNNKLWDIPAKEIDIVLDTNVKGTINVIRHFLPVLIERGHGVVVNISSVLGRAVQPHVAPYCASKWAIEGLSRAVSMEVPPGLAVVTLDPGVIQTDMLVLTFGSKAAHFPVPEVWAPAAVDMILNVTAEDNGAALAVALDEQTVSIQRTLFPEIAEA